MAAEMVLIHGNIICMLQNGLTMRFIDLWLECYSGTPAPMTRWPCVHCSVTTH